MLFNRYKPTITSIEGFPFYRLVDLKNYRLASITRVYKEASLTLKQLLATAPLTHCYKRILVDIKVQDLDSKTHSCGAVKGWHLDGRLMPNSDKNIYHIFTIGGAPTEFIGTPLILPSSNDQRQLVKLIPNNIPVYSLPECVWNTYGEEDWHRGVTSEKPVRRTFIRICETNYLREKR